MNPSTSISLRERPTPHKLAVCVLLRIYARPHPRDEDELEEEEDPFLDLGGGRGLQHQAAAAAAAAATAAIAATAATAAATAGAAAAAATTAVTPATPSTMTRPPALAPPLSPSNAEDDAAQRVVAQRLARFLRAEISGTERASERSLSSLCTRLEASCDSDDPKLDGTGGLG